MSKIIILIALCLANTTYAQDLTFPEGFLFGVSNAPAQVEDELDDPWMEFGRNGNISAFQNYAIPEAKIRFWTEYEREVELAEELGVDIFRLGTSWHRLIKKENGVTQYNKEAIEKYKKILSHIKSKNMKVMLTLFHHSLPDWAIKDGGWTNPEMIGQFVEYGKFVADHLEDQVDYWTTFNEPNVYSMFSYVVGNWPSNNASFLGLLNLGFYQGNFFKALDNMAEAHKQIYQYIHSKNRFAKVGVAHNTANYKDGGIGGGFAAQWSWDNMNWYFPDKIKNSMDFMGINYYGSEYLSMFGVNFSDKAEYNDAGRAIDANGFYEIIKKYNKRYGLPVFITENGTADEDDLIRPVYLTQHLVAVHKAISEKIPVLGYIYWTLSDNLEWSDGYCPKFGLVAVDRKRGLQRSPRKSFYLYQEGIASGGISGKILNDSWKEYSEKWGEDRKMCRAKNGKDGLDEVRVEQLKSIDWRVK